MEAGVGQHLDGREQQLARTLPPDTGRRQLVREPFAELPVVGKEDRVHVGQRFRWLGDRQDELARIAVVRVDGELATKHSRMCQQRLCDHPFGHLARVVAAQDHDRPVREGAVEDGLVADPAIPLSRGLARGQLPVDANRAYTVPEEPAGGQVVARERVLGTRVDSVAIEELDSG